MTTTMKKRVEGHYEVEEVPYGRVYKWTPGHALVKCDCGELTTIAAPTTTICPGCGADYAAVAQGLEGKPLKEDEAYCPEHREYEDWQREEAAAHPYLKRYEWLEVEALRR